MRISCRYTLLGEPFRNSIVSDDDNKNLPSKREILDVYSKLSKVVSHMPKADISLDAKTGMSLIQAAQVAINQIAELLSGMRILAEKTASGNLSSSETNETIQQFVSLHNEIDRIARDASYNNIQLLDGSLGTVYINSETLQLPLQIKSFTAENLGLNSHKVDLYDINDAQQALHVIKKAIETVNTTLNSLDRNEVTLQKLIGNDKEEVDFLTDLMFAVEISQQTRHMILELSKLALLSHSITRDMVLDVLKQS